MAHLVRSSSDRIRQGPFILLGLICSNYNWALNPQNRNKAQEAHKAHRYNLPSPKLIRSDKRHKPSPPPRIPCTPPPPPPATMPGPVVEDEAQKLQEASLREEQDHKVCTFDFFFHRFFWVFLLVKYGGRLMGCIACVLGLVEG